MPDTNTIKYVSLGNLERFQTLNKQYIDAQDAALKSNLEGQLDTVASAVDAEATRAKGEEAKNAAAAQAAKDAADAAQDHSEALAAKVGEVAEGKTVVGMIQDVIDAAYDDTEVRGLISNLDTNKADKTQVATDISTAVAAETSAREAAVAGVQGSVDTLSQTHATDKKALEDAIALKANQTAVDGLAGRMDTAEADIENIEKDYLKAADKTELEGKITAEKNRAEAAEGGLDERLVRVETFFETAEGETLDTALDTLVELQEYLNGEGEVADQMLLDIAKNAEDIAANKKSIDDHVATNHDFAGADAALKSELEGKIALKADASTVSAMDTAYKAADDAIKGRLDDLEAINHDAYIAADTALKNELNTEIAKKANQTALDQEIADREAGDTAVRGYVDEKNTAMDTRVKALEAIDHDHSNKAELDLINTGDVAKWNAAEANAIAHANSLNTAMDSRVTDVETFIGNIEFCENSDIDALFA